MREYTINYRSSNDDGSSSVWTAFASFNSLDDKTDFLTKEYQDAYQNDPNFNIIGVYKQSIDEIDYELIDRMSSIRDMCELGHKVRADVKIRNRQPLTTAYVLFANKQVQNYMVYVDCRDNDYADVLGEELNVENVVFIENADQFTDIVLKPNFRSLGKKGFGKQANVLKTELVKLSFADRKALHNKLENKEAVNMAGIDLILADLEVEFVSKAGYASASNKSGVIILDTNLNERLLEKGFVADLKSSLQNIRKELGLELTDRVYIELYCNDVVANVVRKHSDKLKKELLANDMAFLPSEQASEGAKKIDIDGKSCRVSMCKENKL